MTLTPARLEILNIIATAIQDRGIAPNYPEIMALTGIKSRAAVHHHIGILERDGYISRKPHRARALAILRMPGDAPPPTEKEIADLAAAMRTAAGPGSDFTWRQIAVVAMEFTRRKERP